MKDPVKVNYNVLEELFAQTKSENLTNVDPDKRRGPTEV